ncbi:hypothetical protein [uncultured Desulfosarcina sp.]|uniref:hypothetical protein n=1 Tax=uncultured Desulfosarcina sp. TaxID=218289 RepID=UPI0029C760C5|nr:hypothetical protein [uncultured Desulfosarcina sp.]
MIRWRPCRVQAVPVSGGTGEGAIREAVSRRYRAAPMAATTVSGTAAGRPDPPAEAVAAGGTAAGAFFSSPAATLPPRIRSSRVKIQP